MEVLELQADVHVTVLFGLRPQSATVWKGRQSAGTSACTDDPFDFLLRTAAPRSAWRRERCKHTTKEICVGEAPCLLAAREGDAGLPRCPRAAWRPAITSQVIVSPGFSGGRRRYSSNLSEISSKLSKSRHESLHQP